MIEIKIFKFYFIILILLFSCQEKKDVFGFEFTQKSIPLKAKGQELYSEYQLSLSKGKHILIGFDGTRNTVDFFDLEKKTLFKSVSFDEAGPNGIGKPQKYYYYSDKKMFFYDGYQLIEIDIKGNTHKRLSLWKKNPSSKEDKARRNNPINFPPYFPFVFQQTDGNIYYTRTRYVDQMIHEAFDNKTSIIGQLNWQNGDTKDLPIYFPDFLLEKNKYFGLLYHPQLLFWKNKLVINYPSSSKIFVYSKEGKMLKEYEALSVNTSNQMIGLSIAEKDNFVKVIKNLDEGPHFYPLHYDVKNKVFYRFHEISELDTKGERLKRDIYLMIMNEKFEVVQEEKMPETVNNPTLSLVLPEGGLLVGAAGDQLKENHFTYNVIKINKKK